MTDYVATLDNTPLTGGEGVPTSACPECRCPEVDPCCSKCSDWVPDGELQRNLGGTMRWVEGLLHAQRCDRCGHEEAPRCDECGLEQARYVEWQHPHPSGGWHVESAGGIRRGDMVREGDGTPFRADSLFVNVHSGICAAEAGVLAFCPVSRLERVS